MPKLHTSVFGIHQPLLDARLTNPRFNNYAYAPPVASSKAEWDERADWIRRRILLSAGLLPLPERAPLKARVFDRSELDGCSIEKAHFESRPGFLVTGNVLRPLDAKGRRPAVLCPHGHWPQGRMTPEDPDKGCVMARCLMLARLGFVVFVYDMVGYNDSCQVEHRWPERTLNRSLLYGIGPFGLQLWNGIRAIDFVSGLPDVDPKRVGCTGASGGATQTYYLSAVDDRIKVAVPVCMMSSHYQGGCTCEEPPHVHLGDISTLDVVASLVPRPVLLPSVTQDWSNQNPSVDFPAVRRIYELYGAGDRIANVHFDAPHNYNQDTREHAYAWLVRWLAGRKGVGARIKEANLQYPTPAQARVFPAGKPPKRLKRGKQLIEKLMREDASPFARPPKSAAALKRFRSAWLPAYREVLDVSEPLELVSVGTPGARSRGDGFKTTCWVLGRYGAGEQTPALWIEPDGASDRAPAVVFAGGKGKAALFVKSHPVPALAGLIGAGFRVLALDLLGTGETKPMLGRYLLHRKDPRFHAFNRSLLDLRVQEVLTALAALRQHKRVRHPILFGAGTGAAAALLARTVAGRLAGTVADLTGLDTDADAFWLKLETHHPLIRKVGDLRGAVALGPASPLMLCGASASIARWGKAAPRPGGGASSLKICRTTPPARNVASWLARQATR